MNTHEGQVRHEENAALPQPTSPEVRLQPEEETMVITRRQQEILQLTAEGFLVSEIGSKLHIAAPTVKDHLRKLHQIDDRPTLGIIVEGLETGLVDPERVLAGRDPKAVDTLTPGQRDIMESLMQTPQTKRHDLREWTAEKLGLSPYTVKNQLTGIAGKLDTRGLVHAGAVFAAAHKVRSQK